MSDGDCFWHGEEPLPAEYYQLCGECGHVWPTEAEFIAAIEANGLAAETNRWYCPLCAHNF